MKAARKKPYPWLSPGVFVGGLVPLTVIVVGLTGNSLGADPIAEILNRLGLLALIFLIGSLTCTPLRILFDWRWPLRIRRMLGLYAFFYASLHFCLYAFVDKGARLSDIIDDIAKRPFILVGFTAFLLLIPLALTSTANAVRRLGGRRWQLLHRSVYAIGVLAVIHFYLRVKKDTSEPTIYAVILLLLFLVRLLPAFRRRRDAWTSEASGSR